VRVVYHVGGHVENTGIACAFLEITYEFYSSVTRRSKLIRRVTLCLCFSQDYSVKRIPLIWYVVPLIMVLILYRA
jgi:hypothetical protein